MARNSIDVSVSPERAFATLDDAYAYPRWVVGTRRIRAVDANWPEVGSRFHHAVGTAAGELHDSSSVLARVPSRRMDLEVRFRPGGTARVEIELTPTDTGTRITLREIPTSGPIALLPSFVADPVLALRNAISLQRLRHEIERAAEQRPGSAEPVGGDDHS